MSSKRFTVRYGIDGGRYWYTHADFATFEEAAERCDKWFRGNGWGGYPPGEMRCWVESNGEVVYGTPATKEEVTA